ncbi:MAG: hypothetical protein WDO18_06010 [Acidobacteriota bacterium]
MSDFWLTWYQPLIGALHVLGIALFGGTLFADAPILRRIGIVWMLLTGALLYAVNAAHVAHSVAFHLKLALLAALLFVRRPRWLVLGLWIAVIFASRGVAYF